MALIIQQSEKFEDYLETQRQRFDYLDEKLLEFLEKKIEFYNQNPTGILPPINNYDRAFNPGHLRSAVSGETLRHAHLSGDTNLVYSIVQSGDDKIIKLYGIFSHRELGTDPHMSGKISAGSGIIKTLANLGSGTWTEFPMDAPAPEIEEPEVSMEKIDKIEILSKTIDAEVLRGFLSLIGLKIPAGTPIRNQLSLFLREPNAKKKLIDYNLENPIDLLDLNDELYLKDHNDVHLLFLLKRVGKSDVAVNVIGDRRTDNTAVDTDRRKPVSEEDDSNMSWEELLSKYL